MDFDLAPTVTALEARAVGIHGPPHRLQPTAPSRRGGRWRSQKVVDLAIQTHGGAGVTADFGRGFAALAAHAMHIFDSPDEVGDKQIGRMEVGKQA